MSPSKLNEVHLPCPSCPSSDAYCTYEDGHGYCFSCKTYFNANKRTNSLDYTYEYLPWRGVRADVFKFYDIKTKIDAEGKPVAIGYKYPNGSYKVRKLDEKEFYWEGESKPSLFGSDKFGRGSHRCVTITEGELDAASLYQVLGSPVVSVHSAGTAGRDCTVGRAWLNSFEKVYLAFDDDAAGRDATANVARLFDYNKVFVVRFQPRKDANEWLGIPGGEDELRTIWTNSRRYLPDNIVSTSEDFKRILSEEPKAGVPYPFVSWNEKTYGMRTGESVLITAPEGVGKTELMHNLEYQLLMETDDNVGAIFLEEPKRRHLQALAGLALKKQVHLPDSGVSNEEAHSAVEAILRKDERLHVYSHFGSDDPDAILDTIRFLVAGRSCRWVLLDHITMVVSALAGEDERRALDHLSTRLEMMVKELDFGLILVSHVNDFGQTRGSRNISKVADIRIDIKRDVTNTDETIRNTTHATCSKNRFSGKTGPLTDIVFDPLTGTYSELDTFSNAFNPTQQELPWSTSSSLQPDIQHLLKDSLVPELTGSAVTSGTH